MWNSTTIIESKKPEYYYSGFHLYRVELQFIEF